MSAPEVLTFRGGRRLARRVASRIRRGVARAAREDGLLHAVETAGPADGWGLPYEEVHRLTGAQVRRHWPLYTP